MDNETAVTHGNILCWTLIEYMKQCSSIGWVFMRPRRSQVLAQILCPAHLPPKMIAIFTIKTPKKFTQEHNGKRCTYSVSLTFSRSLNVEMAVVSSKNTENDHHFGCCRHIY
jgi:hypothetical protein